MKTIFFKDIEALKQRLCKTMERKLIKLFLLLNLRLINVDTRTYIDVSKISI